ncbi:zinc-containing alcohol dehydrogenase [Dacryopinax primogenitus]|uniref:Zinc-containing alcohol dehydrogenase n=1 Tax=Dacryopinax primogenitus (strain DJM 731) TaxID=1858805 RepID=M5FS20_DACPD|nr:zinc-containing alcohol dehydrogenase [Dacryopinax primogenitus]EJU00091.1 zinc-containing alcohol dehydrogenase [Dacryopinax primogenitus]
MGLSTDALVITKPGSGFALEKIQLEEIEKDEVLVEMYASGICHTDLIVEHGFLPVGGFPIVVGHEGSGIVKGVGSSVTNVAPGDGVLLSFTSCGTCRACKSHHTAYCETFHAVNFGSQRPDKTPRAANEQGRVEMGFFGQSSFARDSVVCAASCVKVDRLTEDEMRLLAPLGCGLMTGAGTVDNIFAATAPGSIAVFGMGGVGFGAIFAAKSRGLSPIIAVDIDDSRLALALELGATHTIIGKQEKDVVGAIRALSNGGVNYSVETTANNTVKLQAINSVYKLGKVGIVGTTGTDKVEVEVDTMIKSGASIIGVAMGDAYTSEYLPKLVEEYRAGRFPLDKLTKHYKPEEIDTAVKEMISGQTIKPIIVWR